jgi:hypothetical protein
VESEQKPSSKRIHKIFGRSSRAHLCDGDRIERFDGSGYTLFFERRDL